MEHGGDVTLTVASIPNSSELPCSCEEQVNQIRTIYTYMKGRREGRGRERREGEREGGGEEGRGHGMKKP